MRTTRRLYGATNTCFSLLQVTKATTGRVGPVVRGWTAAGTWSPAASLTWRCALNATADLTGTDVTAASCELLPHEPCFANQQDCWNVCPSHQLQKTPPAAPAPAPASRQEVPLGAPLRWARRCLRASIRDWESTVPSAFALLAILVLIDRLEDLEQQ